MDRTTFIAMTAVLGLLLGAFVVILPRQFLLEIFSEPRRERLLASRARRP